MEGAQSATGDSKRALWIGIGLALVAVLLYSGTLSFGYVYDDKIIAQYSLNMNMPKPMDEYSVW